MTSCACVQCAVRVVDIPVGSVIKGALDIVHKVQHFYSGCVSWRAHRDEPQVARGLLGKEQGPQRRYCQVDCQIFPRLIFWKLRPRTFSRAPFTFPTPTANAVTMPKSKRAKVVHLTKTDKKGKELSLKLFANVQEAADNYEHIFVFSVENMRNSYLKEVRQEFADSRYTPIARLWNV